MYSPIAADNAQEIEVLRRPYYVTGAHRQLKSVQSLSQPLSAMKQEFAVLVVCHHGTQEIDLGSLRDQGQPHREFEASLGYIKPCLKRQAKKSLGGDNTAKLRH